MYNTIRRHVFLPSVSELGKVVDLKNPDKVKAFLNGASIQTRDSYQCDTDHTMILSAYDNNINTNITGIPEDVRPAFVVDLSQVNYSVVK